MALGTELKRRAPHVLGPLAALLLVAYFAYHAVEGERGIRAFQRLDAEIADATEVRDRYRTERTLLERKVAALHPDSLDPDLLEERARVVLGLIPQDGIVLGPAIVPSTQVAELGRVR